MRLSTRGRYGCRAMLELALRYNNGPVQLREIARSQEVSERYLEHLVTTLKVAGLVKSTRGAKGGFVLSRQPSRIKMSEVVRVLEGSLSPLACIDEPETCRRSPGCVSRDLWMDMKNAMLGVLEGTTLQDLVDRHRASGKNVAMYDI